MKTSSFTFACRLYAGRNILHRRGKFFFRCCVMPAMSVMDVIHRHLLFFLMYAVSYLCFIVGGMFTQKIHAQNPEELFNTANTYYQHDEFHKAAEYYEKIIALGYESEAVYYNLGNCYYKLNETGRAILNYERALKIAPTNEDIVFNLKLANLRVADRIEPLPQMMLTAWIKNLLSAFTADGWAIASIFSLWLALAFISGYLFIPSSSLRQFSFFAALFSLLLSILLFLTAWRKQSMEKNQRYGIVMVTNTYIKSAPALNATDLFILREGVKAEILEDTNGWCKIRLADGKVGWIQQPHIEII